MKPIGILADEPRTFSIFNVTMYGGILPILMVDDLDGRPQLVGEAADFARSLVRRGLSLSRVRSAMHTIGLLHDHLLYCEADRVRPENLPGVVHRFLVNRLRGTIDKDGSDPTGLFWSKVRWEAVKRDRSHLRAYSDFCARHYGHFPLIPKCEPVSLAVDSPAFKSLGSEFAKRRSEMARVGRSDLLAHLASLRQVNPIPSVEGRAPRLKLRGNRTNHQHVPLEKIPELILRTPSVVQRMIFIQAAYGGPRPAEQLNQWVDDVLPGSFRRALFPDDEPSDWPLIVLAHPTESTWTGRVGNGSTTRQEFLWQRYGLHPRAVEEVGPPAYAGWKGMAIENEQWVISQVYWISDFWAKQYYAHYEYLLKVIRPKIPATVRRSHPYLYINDSPKTAFYGHPMKMSNLKKAMERAFARVGLEPYQFSNSIYGLRHSYMKMCRMLGLDPEVRQKVMRHLCIESHEAYGQWTPGELNANLRRLLK